jgi:hypothetical protein
MKELKEILICTTPFVVAAVLLYPMMAIVGADTDPFMWQREDRMFYFITSLSLGGMLWLRVNYARKWQA